MTRKRSPEPAPAFAAGRGDLAASLVLIFPLLLAYEIGVLFAGRVDGADVVTRALYAACGGRAMYLLAHALVAVGFLLWIRRDARWGALRLSIALPLAFESAIYACALAALLPLLPLGAADHAISALGAGVHEELVFRLGLVCALVALRGPRRGSFAVALVVSSLAFAAAHHLGVYGEPFALHAFALRAFAGAAFGVIFWYRSLAHAVYAHAIYDLVVVTLAAM